LRRAFSFLILLVVLTIIEEAVVGLFHDWSIAATLGDLFSARLKETLAGCLIMLLVLIPFFAFRVLSEALGEGQAGADVLCRAGTGADVATGAVPAVAKARRDLPGVPCLVFPDRDDVPTHGAQLELPAARQVKGAETGEFAITPDAGLVRAGEHTVATLHHNPIWNSGSKSLTMKRR
jgi:hypothetical protein